uniref:Gnk2-homologous domain-containing protein n=1 Tax=Oryza punctata TaxID=4537 RepID=A0A0E0KMT7_ORYPU
MDSNLAVLLAIVVVCVACTTPPAFAQTVQVWSECSPQNYTALSAYGTSLRRMLKDVIDAAVSGGGYAANDAGVAHGLAICYADARPEVCRLCLGMAAGNLSLACPRAMGAAMLYNNCLLRYADAPFLARPDMNQEFSFYNPNMTSAGDAAQFGTALSRLMDRLGLAAATAAASSSRGRRFAFGQTNITGDDSLYAFVQCVDDLSPDDCRRCLQSIAESLPMTRGGRAYSLTCYTRFEVVPFYRPPNATSLVVVASPAPAPASALLPTESRGE